MKPATACKLLVSLTFGLAAVLKVGSVHQLQLSILASGLIPLTLVPTVAVLVVVLEFVTAVSLWIPRIASLGAWLGALLSALFLGYSFWRAYYGIAVPCQCFGPVLKMPPAASALISGFLLLASVEVIHRFRSVNGVTVRS